MKNSEAFIELVLSESDPERLHSTAFMEDLSAGINWLIDHNFEKLIYLLYRVDVSEEKIKLALEQQPGTNAGDQLAQMIIDRLIQKIQTRKMQTPGDTGNSDAERW